MLAKFALLAAATALTAGASLAETAAPHAAAPSLPANLQPAAGLHPDRIGIERNCLRGYTWAVRPDGTRFKLCRFG